MKRSMEASNRGNSANRAGLTRSEHPVLVVRWPSVAEALGTGQAFLLTLRYSLDSLFPQSTLMMCLSQTTGYAMRALSCLQSARTQPRLVRDVAAETGIPRPYLAKVIGQLAESGLVEARRGQHGGVTLTRPAGQITLLEVVEAVEGKQWISPCILGLETCDEPGFCPAHEVWKRVRVQLEQKLRNTKLSQFIDGTRASQANGITGKTEPLPFRRRSHPLECKTPA